MTTVKDRPLVAKQHLDFPVARPKSQTQGQDPSTPVTRHWGAQTGAAQVWGAGGTKPSAQVSRATAKLNLDFLNEVTDSARFLWSPKAGMSAAGQRATSLDFFKQLLSDPKNASIPLEVKQLALTRFFNAMPESEVKGLKQAMFEQDPGAFVKDPTGPGNTFQLKQRMKIVAQSNIGDGEHELLRHVYQRLMPAMKLTP